MEPQLIRAMAKTKLASPEASNRSLAAIVGVTHPSVAKVLERAEVLELPMEVVAARTPRTASAATCAPMRASEECRGSQSWITYGPWW